MERRRERCRTWQPSSTAPIQATDPAPPVTEVPVTVVASPLASASTGTPVPVEVEATVGAPASAQAGPSGVGGGVELRWRKATGKKRRRGCHFLYWGTREKILRGDGGSAGTARYRPVRWTSCRLSSRELLKKGIRWGAAGLWKYYRRESAGERRGYGNTTEGNPLGSGGAMEILQKGIRWGAAGLWKYYRRESAGERRGCGNTTEGNPLGSGHGNGVGGGWGALTGFYTPV